MRGALTQTAKALSCACVALLVGCGQDRANSPTASSSPTESVADVDDAGYLVDGPLVVAPACGRSDDDCDPGDALISGVIRFDQSCSFVDSYQESSLDDNVPGGQTFALLWMHGVEWDPSVDAARVAADVLVRDGDEVDVGGGGGTFDNLAYWYPGAEVPAQLGECASQAGVSGFWIGSALPRSP